MNVEELKEYINAKRNPISHCIDLTNFFIGRHEISPVYLTPTFELEFNLKMCKLKELEKQNEFLMKRDNKCQVLEQVIDKLKEKCKPKTSYDYDVWAKLNEDWKTLTNFNEHIKYNLHPIITDAYRCDIKNSINKIIEVTKNDVVLKEDILDILKEVE